MVDFTHINVSPVSPLIGAEISGIDLSAPLDAEVIAEIQQALLTYLVIFFRDQSLEPDQLKTAATQFGTPVPYPFVDGIDGFPEIIEVLKLPGEQENFGGVWHSDTAYLQSPTMGAMLFANEIPPIGGDTLFSNMYTAFEQLSPGLQGFLSGLNALNDADKSEVAQTRVNRIAGSTNPRPQKNLKAIHPVVRTHPETNRKLLYINRAHTTRFEGMSRMESDGLLDYLFEIQSRPEYGCRFRWRNGSLAFWDNRACLHYPLNDYPGQRRLMHRISLAGDKPF
jgi:taurine dioxygenase